MRRHVTLEKVRVECKYGVDASETKTIIKQHMCFPGSTAMAPTSLPSPVVTQEKHMCLGDCGASEDKVMCHPAVLGINMAT
jgi:hypothetical protein